MKQKTNNLCATIIQVELKTKVSNSFLHKKGFTIYFYHINFGFTYCSLPSRFPSPNAVCRIGNDFSPIYMPKLECYMNGTAFFEQSYKIVRNRFSSQGKLLYSPKTNSLSLNLLPHSLEVNILLLFASSKRFSCTKHITQKFLHQTIQSIELIFYSELSWPAKS